MKDISIYFSPVELLESYPEGSVGQQIDMYQEGNFPEIKKGGIALIYMPEYRNGAPEFQGKSSDTFRNYLYRLYPGVDWRMPLYDCGTIFPGKEIKDSYYALAQVTAELVKCDVLPVVIGGTQDLTFAMYEGYELLEQLINICSIDHKLDLGNPDESIDKDGFLSHILLHRPCYLFNYSNIGCQAPFVSPQEFTLFEKLYFDVCRLGEFNTDFKVAEPHIRNADIFSLDMQSIRASELNASTYDSPNGFYADQVCQIAKYAGISDKLTSFGLFNLFPIQKASNLNHLVAQIIWYFIDGFSQRKGDFPVGSKKDYMKFTVNLDNFKDELIFYKSNKSDRWWMEVPYPPSKGVKFDRHHLVPCNHLDYDRAMKNEVPDLWWKTYQKLG
jgi:formiminoglutamase